jgi:hypothetical protein
LQGKKSGLGGKKKKYEERNARDNPSKGAITITDHDEPEFKP